MLTEETMNTYGIGSIEEALSGDRVKCVHEMWYGTLVWIYMDRPTVQTFTTNAKGICADPQYGIKKVEFKVGSTYADYKDRTVKLLVRDADKLLWAIVKKGKVTTDTFMTEPNGHLGKTLMVHFDEKTV